MTFATLNIIHELLKDNLNKAEQVMKYWHAQSATYQYDHEIPKEIKEQLKASCHLLQKANDSLTDFESHDFR